MSNTPTAPVITFAAPVATVRCPFHHERTGNGTPILDADGAPLPGVHQHYVGSPAVLGERGAPCTGGSYELADPDGLTA